MDTFQVFLRLLGHTDTEIFQVGALNVFGTPVLGCWDHMCHLAVLAAECQAVVREEGFDFIFGGWIHLDDPEESTWLSGWWYTYPPEKYESQ